MEIQGYPNYLIYPDGRVWSLYKNIFLKGWSTKVGYMQVRLCKDRVHTAHLVHRLVAIHYIQNPDNISCVDHIDRNRHNNHISNLRWVTPRQNSSNRGECIHNTSGHKFVSYTKWRNKWVYGRMAPDGNKHTKSFHSKIDAICYKYIMNLRIKAGHFGRL